MKEKTLPKAFRITEETANKFKEIAQDLGGNQQQTLAKLIEVYETESGKEALPEMREQIDTFDSHLHALSAIFLQILESNHTMRAQVRTEFQAQLGSKDRTILELQDRLKTAEESKDEFKKKESEYITHIKADAEKISSLEKDLEKEQKHTEKLEEESKQQKAAFEREKKQMQSAEAEVRSSLNSFMQSNEHLKEENEKLRSQAKELDVQVFQLGRESETRRVELEKLAHLIEQHEKDLADALQKQETEHLLAMKKREMELKDQFYEREQKIRDELDRYKEFFYKNQKENDRSESPVS